LMPVISCLALLSMVFKMLSNILDANTLNQQNSR